MPRYFTGNLRLVDEEQAPAIGYDGYLYTMNGKLQPNMHNAKMVLDREGISKRLAKDLLRFQIVWREGPPWEPEYKGPFRQEDLSRLMSFFPAKINVFIPKEHINDAVAAAAEFNKYDPVQERLLPLEWDQVPRIDTWLVDYLGATDTRAQRKIGAWWLMGAAARALTPGCKFDHVLVLYSQAQGIYKSSALRALAYDEFFSDEPVDIVTKDGMMQNVNCWIREAAELSGMEGADANRLKQWLTKREDRFRPPYASAVETFLRHCAFTATTNDIKCLSDPTGDRRLWMSIVTWAKVEEIERDRDQLWAEAVHRVKANERRFPKGAEDIGDLRDNNIPHVLNDPWELLAGGELRNKPDASIVDVFESVKLDKSAMNAERRHTKRAVQVLQRLGFTNRIVTDEGEERWSK